MKYDDDIILSDKEKDFLIQVLKLPFLERCKKLGVTGKEIETPFGILRVIEGVKMKLNPEDTPFGRLLKMPKKMERDFKFKNDEIELFPITPGEADKLLLKGVLLTILWEHRN